ncbi:hypothetical protein N9N75_04390 [Candidatus Pelagibacter sp.]|nr:hypothetical protein [Candidatus Pelagibacter sp.]
MKKTPKNKKIKKISEFNRLIAHTKNLFVISGYGAFTKGYLIIITKELLPSYGLITDGIKKELNYLIKICKDFINKTYSRKFVTFEHGMCACVGGLDRAHIHIMSINNNSTEQTLKTSINQTLFNRKAGIRSIKFKNYKLENLHDINQLYEEAMSKSEEYEIEGELLEIKDIQNLEYKNWPKITFNHISKGGHYVYFESDFENASFLTTYNFKTQLGREIVYNNENLVDDRFKNLMKNINKNDFVNTWQWQNYMFEENIVETLNDAKEYFRSFIKNDYNKSDNFELEVI